jgi:hypothetical protein
MNRRQFFAGLAAGGIVVAGDLWIPGQKLISIPKKKVFDNFQVFIDPALPPNTVSLTVTGTMSGDRIYIAPLGATEEEILNDIASSNVIKYTTEYVQDREVFIRVRNGGITPIHTFETKVPLTPGGNIVDIIRTRDY